VARLIPSLKQLAEEYLRDHCIDLDYAANAGVYLATPAEAAGFPCAYKSQGGLVFPYVDPVTGKPHPTLKRIRYVGQLPINWEGKPVRYEQPKNTPAEAYFDPNVDWEAALLDPRVTICITEGEAKALCYNQHRREIDRNSVAIALGGVDSFREKSSGDLTPWLRVVRLARQQVGGKYRIIFDSDKADKPRVQDAERRLVAALSLDALQGINIGGQQ
jgi:hypothetical protein